MLGFSFCFLDLMLLVKLHMGMLFMLSLGMLLRSLLQYIFAIRQIMIILLGR